MDDADIAAALLDAATKREGALREAMEVMTRVLEAATVRAATSETQRADLDRTTTWQRRTAAKATVPQQGLGAQEGAFTTYTAVNHARSAQSPKLDGSKDY